MNFLVDGHNVIPRVPGLSLSQPDDELRLVEWLQVFCRMGRHKVEVYFDQAPPGFSGRRVFGTVVAHFVLQGKIADDAIISRVAHLGNSVRNWTVVTSDRRVLNEVRARHANVLDSDEFVKQLVHAAQKSQARQKEDPAIPDEDEIAVWMDIFQRHKKL